MAEPWRSLTGQRGPRRSRTTYAGSDAPIQVPNLDSSDRSRLSFDFFPGRPNAGLFPLKTWRRLLQQSLSQGGAAACALRRPLRADRAALGDRGHLAAARGIVADPNDIVVVSGARKASISRRACFSVAGTVGLVETPCYQGAAYAFEACRCGIVRRPGRYRGPDPQALPERPHRCSISRLRINIRPDRCCRLPQRADRRLGPAQRLLILKDDRDSDFRYEGSPLPAIAVTAPDCTIHLGSVLAHVGAGLRLGYIVVPAHSPRSSGRQRRCSTTAIPGSSRPRWRK